MLFLPKQATLWRARNRLFGFGTRAALALLGLGYIGEASAAGDPRGILGGSVRPAETTEEHTSPLSAGELRRLLPDLQLRTERPTTTSLVQLGMHIPYQVLGVGVGVELYPTRWLRFSGLYSFGFSPIQNNVKISHYAEAALGVAVASSGADTEVSLVTRGVPYMPPLALHAFVPTYRAFFIEGGALTGFFSPARCTANCDPLAGQKELVADDVQLLMPFAGVRYVSYYAVASKHARLQQRAYWQVYSHLFMRPFNAPKHPIYSYKGEPLDRGSLGGRVGVDYTPSYCLADAVLHTGCAQGGLALGYNPTPGFVFFEFHVAYLIE